jgi:hypothetical protein
MVHDMRHFFIIMAGLAFAGGCGGGGGGGAPTAAAVAPPPQPPSPTAPPAGALSASRSAVAFSAQGQSATVDVSEPGYSGPIGFDGTACASVVAVAPAAQQPAPATFTLTAQSAGSCTLAFVDRFGQRAPVAIGVTLTQGSIK